MLRTFRAIGTLTIKGFYDEASTLFGSLGRYTGGGSAYDKSYYNSLWGGPKNLKRDLKTGRSSIEFPRFQVTVCSHPQYIVKALTSTYVFYKAIMISI